MSPLFLQLGCLIDCNNLASPDLNPIGKRFNVEKQELKKQSLNNV